MSREHDVITLFREANPVPALEDLSIRSEDAASYLAWVTTLPTTQVAEVDEPHPWRRIRRYLAPALAVTIIATAIVLLFARDNSDSPVASTPTTEAIPPPTAPPSTAPPVSEVAVAEAFVGCMLGECDPATSLGSATVNGEPVAEHLAFRDELHTSLISLECAGESPVVCQATGTDDLRKALRHEFGEIWEVTVVAGEVTSAAFESDDGATLEAYQTWLEAANPEQSPGSPQERAVLWVAHAEEFRESDAFVRPYDLDIVGTWQMVKGEVWTFSEDGIYTVADQNGVYETGNYTFAEPNITIEADESTACPDGAGTYELRFFTADRFGWILVQDECGIRGSLLNGLANRAE